jgi:hypothetical protein
VLLSVFGLALALDFGFAADSFLIFGFGLLVGSFLFLFGFGFSPDDLFALAFGFGLALGSVSIVALRCWAIALPCLRSVFTAARFCRLDHS